MDEHRFSGETTGPYGGVVVNCSCGWDSGLDAMNGGEYDRAWDYFFKHREPQEKTQ